MKGTRWLAGFGAVVLTAAWARAEFRTWTNLEGRTVEAEFEAATSGTVKLRLHDNSIRDYPIAQLSAADHAYLAARAGGTTPPPTAAAPAGKVADALIGKLVAAKAKGFGSFDAKALGGVKYFAIYFSAGWCAPCHAFTPSLVEFYQQHKAVHPEFEVILVSEDNSEDELHDYMAEMKMPWPTVRYGVNGSISLLKKYEESGIPNLVLVDASGTVLAKSFVGDNYVGPTSVMNELGRRLAAETK
jgi:nucleoredoxin